MRVAVAGSRVGGIFEAIIEDTMQAQFPQAKKGGGGVGEVMASTEVGVNEVFSEPGRRKADGRVWGGKKGNRERDEGVTGQHVQVQKGGEELSVREIGEEQGIALVQ